MEVDNDATIYYVSNTSNVGEGTLSAMYWTRTYATESSRKTLIAGVAGRVGVEYFVAPKLSFGGEVSLVVAEGFDRGSYTKSEGVNKTTVKVETHTELISPASRQFHIGTENLGGKLFMMFYF